jgi:hypothetical protein
MCAPSRQHTLAWMLIYCLLCNVPPLSILVLTNAANTDSHRYALCTPVQCEVTINSCLNKAACTDSHHYALCTPVQCSVTINSCLNKSRRLLYPFVPSFSVNGLHNTKVFLSLLFKFENNLEVCTVTSVSRLVLRLTFKWSESQTQCARIAAFDCPILVFTYGVHKIKFQNTTFNVGLLKITSPHILFIFRQEFWLSSWSFTCTYRAYRTEWCGFKS